MCSKTAPHQDRGYFPPKNLAQALYFLYLFLKSRWWQERFPSVVSKAIRTTFLFMYFLYIAWCLSQVCLFRLPRKKTPIYPRTQIYAHTHTHRHTIAEHDDQRWSQLSQEMPDWIKGDRRQKADHHGAFLLSRSLLLTHNTLPCVCLRQARGAWLCFSGHHSV